MYDGSHLQNFRESLSVAKARRKKTLAARETQDVKDSDQFWSLFNSGGTYREVTYGLGYATRSKPVGRVVRRHEARFTDKSKSQRRTTPNLKGQVIELHSRGVIPAAIADTLNVSDRRVKSILAAAY